MLMANGPTGGNLNDVKQMNTIIASPDIVAADSYAATLFNLQPEELVVHRRRERSADWAAAISRTCSIEEINVGA